MNRPALSVRKLGLSLGSRNPARTILHDISFDLAAGEILALVGESGSGKTKTAEAIMGLLPRRAGWTTTGTVMLDDTPLSDLDERALRAVRGRDISMIFQDPASALDPVFTVGNQLAAVIRRHRGEDRRQAREAAMSLLNQVGFADAPRILDCYPHELSGGMRQRIMIAMALSCRPGVLIADEPATALDVTTQAQVLGELSARAKESGTAVLLITHDLGVVAQYCDRALLMRAGELLEDAATPAFFTNPTHSYAREILAASRAVAGA